MSHSTGNYEHVQSACAVLCRRHPAAPFNQTQEPASSAAGFWQWRFRQRQRQIHILLSPPASGVYIFPRPDTCFNPTLWPCRAVLEDSETGVTMFESRAIVR